MLPVATKVVNFNAWPTHICNAMIQCVQPVFIFFPVENLHPGCVKTCCSDEALGLAEKHERLRYQRRAISVLAKG